MQSGGFGSFSKRYGLAAAGLLEAEIVTADSAVRIANACTSTELFWGLKGGGGGSLGVVTRLTLQTHALPTYFGAVFGTMRATSDAAFRALIGRAIRLYQERLFNPHWGEQMVFGPGNTLRIAVVFQGLDQQQAEDVWQPFRTWVVTSPQEFAVENAIQIVSVPARHLWDAAYLRTHAPRLVVADDQPGAPEGHFFWAGDGGQVGQFLHGYRSAWLPASLLQPEQQPHLADALFASTRHWQMVLHFNKGLAGALRRSPPSPRTCPGSARGAP